MKPISSLLLTLYFAFALAGCAEKPPPAPAVSASEPFQPAATLQELMLAVIDPNVDPIWNSISTVVSAEGTAETRPTSDADWQTLRHHAILLREVSNLLLIKGRKVAHPGASTSSDASELHADQIQVLIESQWPEFTARANALHQAADQALRAIDARDVDALEEAGGIIEVSCEACHSQFWYPGDMRPIE